jgi:hypothetical protein
MTEEHINGSHYAIDYHGDGSNLTNLTRSEISAGIPNEIVINDGTGKLSSTTTIGVPNGGTGQTSFTPNDVIIGNGVAGLANSGVNITSILTTLNTQTVYNKTLTDNTNNLTARALWAGSGSTAVSTYAATAPTIGQVLTAASATTATWQTPSSSAAKTTITLVSIPVYVILFMQWQKVAVFTWLNSEYSIYTTGKVVLNPQAGGTITVRLYNTTTATSLGSITTAVSGPVEFSVTLPSANANLELQVQKTVNDMTLPMINGATLILEP